MNDYLAFQINLIQQYILLFNLQWIVLGLLHVLLQAGILSTQKQSHNLIVLMETTFQTHIKRQHLLPERQWKKHFTIQNFHNQAVHFVQHIKKAWKILWSLFGETAISSQITCKCSIPCRFLVTFTFTVFAVHPITPLTFSSVWICSDIVHFWVVIIFSLKMHSTSRFLSITCCSKLLFRSIVLKKKIHH